MAAKIPSHGALQLLRHALHPRNPQATTQVRHATLLRRPKRPYTFTQLVTLSDGSSFVQRTTSPLPVYKSTKDIRNTPLWNPSSQKLLNVEEDEAGKLKAFRAKFGRGWDAENAALAQDETAGAADAAEAPEPTDHLMDLISGGKTRTEAKKAAAATSAPKVVPAYVKGGAAKK